MQVFRNLFQRIDFRWMYFSRRGVCVARHLRIEGKYLSEERFSRDVLLEARDLRSEALVYRGTISFRGKISSDVLLEARDLCSEALAYRGICVTRFNVIEGPPDPPFRPKRPSRETPPQPFSALIDPKMIPK